MSNVRAAASDVVADCVRRCRRRLQVVSATRRAAITIPVAIVVVELIALTRRVPPDQLAALSGTVGAIAVMAAAIPSLLRAPTMRAAAAAIDARLHLQDRTVTALQLVDEGDAMAQLVVRDAAVRLAQLSPAGAFPLEAPVHFRATIAATATATVVFLAIAGAPAASWLTPPSRSGGAAGAGGGRSGRTSKPVSDTRIVEGVAPAASAAEQPREATPVDANREDTPVGRESVRNNDTARGRGGNDLRASELRAPAPGRDTGAAAGSGDAGRGATAFAERAASAAGGVNGARGSNPRAASTRPAPTAPPDSGLYREEYRAASMRTQTAVAQERVPARLRAYVKRYFVAIHP